MLSIIRLTLLLSLLCISLQSPARDRPFVDQSDSTDWEAPEKPLWEEAKVTLPGPYKEQDLQGFQVANSNGRFDYFIDRSTLQIDADQVSRLRLVIRSSNGAVNTSYEGFRCGKRLYKVYAYGGEKDLKEMQQPTWQPIPKSGPDNYRNTLYSDLLCNLNTGRPNPSQAVIEAMQHNRTVNNFFFTQD